MTLGEWADTLSREQSDKRYHKLQVWEEEGQDAQKMFYLVSQAPKEKLGDLYFQTYKIPSMQLYNKIQLAHQVMFPI